MRIKKVPDVGGKSNGVSVIIPAAGSGKRFQESRGRVALPAGRGNLAPADKIYSQLQNQPLIAHTLRAFDSVSLVKEIIVALEPRGTKRFRREILSRLKLRKPLILVNGGKTRSESVWNGLKRVSKKSTYICIHDAARPLVKPDWLVYLMNNLNGWDGAVLGRRSVPTVKVFEPETGQIKRTLDRSELFEAETPQLIKKEAFLNAYETLGKRAFQATDDASLVESVGGRMKAVPHSEPNIKVTTYSDLVLVKKMVENAPALKFGLGFDRHRLVSKRPFYLGGIRLKTFFGPLGHSDGDPLLHAITDAILGAVGAGDIGDFFPDTSKRWKNVKSTRFLAEAVRIAADKGFRPLQVDATIFLERPKLGPQKKKIRIHLAKLLSLSQSDVSIKAKTAEGFGPEGSGDAVSCQVLVVLSSNE